MEPSVSKQRSPSFGSMMKPPRSPKTPGEKQPSLCAKPRINNTNARRGLGHPFLPARLLKLGHRNRNRLSVVVADAHLHALDTSFGRSSFRITV